MRPSVRASHCRQHCLARRAPPNASLSGLVGPRLLSWARCRGVTVTVLASSFGWWGGGGAEDSSGECSVAPTPPPRRCARKHAAAPSFVACFACRGGGGGRSGRWVLRPVFDRPSSLDAQLASKVCSSGSGAGLTSRRQCGAHRALRPTLTDTSGRSPGFGLH